MSAPIDLWLVHPDEAMCASFSSRFSGLPRVTVLQASYAELPPHDCFVTAGNAFGIMTAGIDAAVVAVHGADVMNAVQDRILRDCLGEQPVGTAFIVSTDNEDYPFIAHAPTMRMPAGVDGTDKVYAATWGALLAIEHHNRSAARKIRTAAFPAFGTGFGGVEFDECARQMSVAYRFYVNPPMRLHWDEAVERHRSIVYDAERRVVR